LVVGATDHHVPARRSGGGYKLPTITAGNRVEIAQGLKAFAVIGDALTLARDFILPPNLDQRQKARRSALAALATWTGHTIFAITAIPAMRTGLAALAALALLAAQPALARRTLHAV
jgi:hypothetical protein